MEPPPASGKNACCNKYGEDEFVFDNLYCFFELSFRSPASPLPESTPPPRKFYAGMS